MWKNALLCLLAASLTATLLLRMRHPPANVVVPRTALQSALHRALAEALSDPSAAGSAFGISVQDEAGQSLFSHQEHQALIPASSLKTLTTATALELLGADFRFHTRLLATAQLVEGVIAGDLILLGGGDPTLSLAHLGQCAAALRAQGLREVRGSVLGDGSHFGGSLYGDFWDWGDIGNGYGSPVCGLNLEHNRYTALFAPAQEEGRPAAFIGAQPEVPGITWISEVRTGPEGGGDGVMIHGGERATRLHLRGTVPARQPQFRVSGAVPDPELFAAHHLRAQLMQHGIRITGTASSRSSVPQRQGTATEASPTEALHELWQHQSAPLPDIITTLHASSDNHETECIYRTLGLRTGLPPAEAVRRHWQERGLTFSALRMEDGCGLARADYITAHDLARLQMLAAQGPQGGLYLESLPATLEGSVRYKGGAMSGVRSITGLATRPDGKRLAFALLVNHFSNPRAYAHLRESLVRSLVTEASDLANPGEEE